MALSEFPLSRITPVCSHDPVSVCVHPAFKAQLPRLTRTINLIAAPIAGLPGAPNRFLDDNIVAVVNGPILGYPSSTAQEAQLRSDGIYVYGTPPQRTAILGPTDSPSQIAVALTFSYAVKAPPTAAQEAIALWLVRRAGFRPDLATPNDVFDQSSYPSADAAARRFGALPAAAQSAWLRAHYTALRNGAVSLSDVP
jgi:hypothetical protein